MPSNNKGGFTGRQFITYRSGFGFQIFPIGAVSTPPGLLHAGVERPQDPGAKFELQTVIQRRPPFSPYVPPPAPQKAQWGRMVPVHDQLLQMVAGPLSDVGTFRPFAPKIKRVDNPKYDFGRRGR